MSEVLTLDRVRKLYGQFEAVKELSLSLDSGTFVTLLGPSGCGKSTTLRMVGGFETPTSGRILIDGKDCTEVPPHKRNVNMVFQDYALFPHLDVAGNIAFGLELQGWTKREITTRVAAMLDLVRLTDFAKRRPSELSGGQRQRVALARALAPNPPLLLLDEPLGALDAKLRKEMQVELRHLQRETGKTFVLVTHDQEEALTMSDQIVVMNGGSIEQIGSPTELYANPATEFVARFVGEMNFLPAEYSSRGIVWAGTPIHARMPEGAVPGNCLVAVRPEDIALYSAPPEALPEGGNLIAGNIKERIFRGSDIHYVICTDHGDLSVTARRRYFDMETGPVWMSWDSARSAVLQ